MAVSALKRIPDSRPFPMLVHAGAPGMQLLGEGQDRKTFATAADLDDAESMQGSPAVGLMWALGLEAGAGAVLYGLWQLCHLLFFH